jgi:putative ABC transport system permease protein
VGSVRWRKVAGDLGAYRARTVLVVASIAVGVFAVGSILGGDAILGESLDAAAEASRPANATFYTAVGFDRALVDAVDTMPGVAEAEGRRSVIVRLVSVDGRDVGSRELQLTALPDFSDQRIDVVEGQSGAFPPRRGELSVERSALRVVELAAGQTVTIRTPGGDEHVLDVSGLAHEAGASSGASTGMSPSRRSPTWAGPTTSTSCGSGPTTRRPTEPRSRPWPTPSASGSSGPARPSRSP